MKGCARNSPAPDRNPFSGHIVATLLLSTNLHLRPTYARKEQLSRMLYLIQMVRVRRPLKSEMIPKSPIDCFFMAYRPYATHG